MHNKLISIIIPSFNKAAFIGETITSVKQQNYADWELIIVDDGSTDKSLQLIADFCEQDSRIKVFQREELPRGGSACRNLGLKHAKGNYIVFLDADDILSTRCLNTRFLAIERFPNHKFWVFPIGTFYKNIGDSSSVWTPKGSDFLRRFLKHNLPWHTMSVVWKKKYLDELKGFDMDYPRLQDVELHTRALLKSAISFKTFPDNQVDAYYRIDEQRTHHDLEQKLTKQMKGVVLYLEKIGVLLKTTKDKKAIKATLFSFVTTLNYNCFVIERNVQLHQKILENLNECIRDINLFNEKDLRFMWFYVRLYQKGFWKIKGYNYLMTALFTKI